MIDSKELLTKLDTTPIPLEVDLSKAAEDLGCDQDRLVQYFVKITGKAVANSRAVFRSIIKECDHD